MDDASNHDIYDVNTIANYDPEIIPLRDSPVGTAFIRTSEGLTLDPLGASVGEACSWIATPLAAHNAQCNISALNRTGRVCLGTCGIGLHAAAAPGERKQ